MAKDFLSLIKARKTISDFSGRNVLESDLVKILEAARWSPSFLNLQPWEFVIIREKETICKLLASAYYGLYSCREHESTPPVIVAVVLKKKYWEGEYGYPRRDKPGVFEAYLSIAMPVMNMALAAADAGIGSGILNVNAYTAARTLRLKDGDSVPIIVCLGYEKPGVAQKKRTRRPLSSLVHYECYGGKK